MENEQTPAKEPKKRKQYKKILDVPLGKIQRRASVTALDSETITEAAERAGTEVKNLHIEGEVHPVLGMKVGKFMSKAATLDKIVDFCNDLLSRDADTPLKHSDQVAAARLLAEISGITNEKKNINVNVGILDLRQASDEELAAELARIEEQQRNVIDVPSETQPDTSIL